jgi:hypothetical protein
MHREVDHIRLFRSTFVRDSKATFDAWTQPALRSIGMPKASITGIAENRYKIEDHSPAGGSLNRLIRQRNKFRLARNLPHPLGPPVGFGLLDAFLGA